MKKQQKKQAGFIVSAELVLIATILVIGLIVGMVTIRNAMIAEMDDVAEAIGAIDQSYSFEGVNTSPVGSWTAGSVWTDTVDSEAGDGQEPDFQRAASGDGTEDELDQN